MKITFKFLLAATLFFAAANVNAQTDPMVGGAAMYPTKNIVENAVLLTAY
jgi:hypothetical protein